MLSPNPANPAAAKGKHFFRKGLEALESGNWMSAERSLALALVFEPKNPEYTEKLNEARRRASEYRRISGALYRIF